MYEFIKNFAFGGLISIGIGSAKAHNAKYVTLEELPELPPDKDVYFGPAMRSAPGDLKANILGSIALWAEVDNENKPRWTLTPTFVVFSGHGWHCYWLLDKPCLNPDTIESLNKLLMEDVKGDHCWNVNRVLRVPGTTNNKHITEPDKYNKPVPVVLKYDNPGIRYRVEDFEILNNLPKTTRHKIATGDSRGYRSRSERDWQIVLDLVASGASDDLILQIFNTQPCGDKHRESTASYIEHTLERIRAKNPVVSEASGEDVRPAIIERADGYYVPLKKGARRVSTFILDPTILLDGSAFETPDSLVCDVRHEDYVWEDKVFDRTSFNSVSQMAKNLSAAAWQWLGRDDDVKELLPFLLEKLKSKGLPRVAATKMMGLHNINGKWLFLGDKQVLSKDHIWEGFNGPLAWMTSKVEHPSLDLKYSSNDDLRVLGNLIPELNEPTSIWPMIGWYTAAVLKPWIESQNYRFPILNVSGTRGAGKTTLIQRVFMPMFGQTNPISYDSGTTKFVTLAIMGSSNAVPVAFSEFRVDAVQRFLRFVLLSYDTGHDPRGRADQTTQDYPLQSPFSLDGEDIIDDPAARERIVVAKLHPQTIEEGSPSYMAFKEMFAMGGVPMMGGSLISKILQFEEAWPIALKEAREKVFKAFPGKIPDRVRNNHIICYFGILLWCGVTETDTPHPEVLSESINAVFDVKAGRSRTLCDEMVEYVINRANAQGAPFKYDVQEGVFWFQMAPAYGDWVTSRRRQGRGTLEQDSMKTQLAEAPYSIPPSVHQGVWMYGVNLTAASDSGLDVPSSMNVHRITINV